MASEAVSANLGLLVSKYSTKALSASVELKFKFLFLFNFFPVVGLGFKNVNSGMFTSSVSDCVVNSGMLFEVDGLGRLGDSGRGIYGDETYCPADLIQDISI